LEHWLEADFPHAKRIGVLGHEDVFHPHFSFEVKERKELPKFLKNCVAQAERNCEQGKMPIVLLHELNSHHSQDLAIIKYINWKQLALRSGLS